MNIAFVPVRCGSKSIPLKNIKDFCGRPLVYWTLNELEKSFLINKIVVATDCNEIRDIVTNFNFSKVEIYDRSLENAGDNSSSESVILEYINSNNFNDEDLFMLVQVTSPFTLSSDFDNSIIKIKSENGDSLLSCVRNKRFYWLDNALPLNYDYLNRPRRQDFNGLLLENGAFYLNSIKGIKTNLNRLGGKVLIYEMPEYTAIEIDEPLDWEIAEIIFKKYLKVYNQSINQIKLFFSDVDGTLTDAGMYYDQFGNEMKKFNTYDGKAFELLKLNGVKTGLITSEKTVIVENRAKKLKIDYLIQGVTNSGKLEAILNICKQNNLRLDQVAYIGDDINCKELLENVGICACPNNAVAQIKNIQNIILLKKNGGDGAVREFVEILLNIA